MFYRGQYRYSSIWTIEDIIVLMTEWFSVGFNLKGIGEYLLELK